MSRAPTYDHSIPEPKSSVVREEHVNYGFPTGSGKTLTTFKAAILIKENEQIHKWVFVVDRKDLDRHTREEINRFQEGCVEENTDTECFRSFFSAKEIFLPS